MVENCKAGDAVSLLLQKLPIIDPDNADVYAAEGRKALLIYKLTDSWRKYKRSTTIEYTKPNYELWIAL